MKREKCATVKNEMLSQHTQNEHLLKLASKAVSKLKTKLFLGFGPAKVGKASL